MSKRKFAPTVALHDDFDPWGTEAITYWYQGTLPNRFAQAIDLLQYEGHAAIFVGGDENTLDPQRQALIEKFDALIRCAN